MWGWLDGIVSALRSVVEKITQVHGIILTLQSFFQDVLPRLIFEKFFEVLQNIINGVTSIGDGIAEIFEFLGQIPELIFGLFKALLESLQEGLVEFLDNAFTTLYNNIVYTLEALFVPDTEYIESEMNKFTEFIQQKFGFNTYVFKNLFTSFSPIHDVTVNYTIPYVGSFNLKVLDASFVVAGVDYFRPFIRGFLTLLMFLFHVKQVISFFGYDAGVVSGRGEHIESARKEQKEGK